MASTEKVTRGRGTSKTRGRGDGGTRRPGDAGTRRRWTSVVAIVVLIVLGTVVLWIFWPALTASTSEAAREAPGEAAGETPAQVTAVIARRSDFALRSEATGHLAPWRKVDISAAIEGRVVERPVREGDYVQKGDLLFRLDGREQRIALAEAKGALLEARAKYAAEIGLDVEGAGTSDTTRLARVRQAYRQAQEQFRNGEISQNVVDRARRRLEAVQMISGQNSAQVRAARTGLIAAEQQVARARLALERTEIRAPFSGRVADLKVTVGQLVSPGTPQLTLLADRRVKVEVNVLESDIAYLEEGASARVRIPALGDTLLTGRIYTINPYVDSETGTGRVTVAIPNPVGRLMAGLFAFVELETRQLQDRLVVPEEALLVRQGRDLVFVVEGGRAQWTYVEVGPRSSGYAVIHEGISAGDTVAVDGHFALAHDVSVAVTMQNGKLPGVEKVGELVQVP